MPTFRVGDDELYYERSGSGEPLLLIMGMSGTHLTWGEPFLDALRRDFEIAVYDHRGMGRSAPTQPPFSIADLADDAAAALDELGWPSARGPRQPADDHRPGAGLPGPRHQRPARADRRPDARRPRHGRRDAAGRQRGADRPRHPGRAAGGARRHRPPVLLGGARALGG